MNPATPDPYALRERRGARSLFPGAAGLASEGGIRLDHRAGPV